MGRGRGRGRGGETFLRSGKNQCDIRAKHKNFGKNMICSENICMFAKLRYMMLGKIFYVSGKIFVCLLASFCMACPEKFCLVCPKNIIRLTPPPPVSQHFGGEILMLSLPVRANCTVPPPTPNKTRPVRPCV